MLGEEQKIINKHLLDEVIKIYHIGETKADHAKTITTRRIVLMSQFDNDEERETLQKRQRTQEDTVMRRNINPQQVTKLLRKQQLMHKRQKEKSISLTFDVRPQISPKHEQKSNGQEHQRWPKKELKSLIQQLAEEKT